MYSSDLRWKDFREVEMDVATWSGLDEEKGERSLRPVELPELERLEGWEDLGMRGRDMRGSVDRKVSGGVEDELEEVLTCSAIFKVRMRELKSAGSGATGPGAPAAAFDLGLESVFSSTGRGGEGIGGAGTTGVGSVPPVFSLLVRSRSPCTLEVVADIIGGLI